MNLNIISGETVDLISPFPLGEARRVFGWSHCYRTLSESDDSPQDAESFTRKVEELIVSCPTWGVIDKGRLTNANHEAPLVGIVVFEPTGLRSGYLHFASARKAFKAGLVDEALESAVDWIFDNAPALLRVGAYMDEKNTPAKGAFRRVGFRFEGLIEDAVLHLGQPKSVAYFGLTRRKWDESNPRELVPLIEEPAAITLSEIDAKLAA